ncbi:MAG: DUF1565 domain-containing protein [Deltaproteobacteria bacterium]|nr:DUF1565 domain-containing protein [Deltaproteobacteria bacterium]
MLFALETPGHLVVEAYALSEAPTIPAFRRTFERNVGERAEMTALFYASELDELGFDPGIVPSSTPGSPERPLPPFDVAVVNRLDASNQTGWIPLPSLEGTLAAFRTPVVDRAERCASQGGCYADASAAPTCLVPCPESQIEDVTPPAPVVVTCPDGWRLEEGGERFCDPYPDGELECGDGAFQRPGDSACQPIGRTCPEPGAWPSDLPESSAEQPLLFVEQNNPGPEQDADGSIARPFHTIGRALVAARTKPNALVVISEGTYSESIVLEGQVSLRGTCATRTILQPTGGEGDDAGTAISVQGTATLEDLTVQHGAYNFVVQPSEANLRVRGVRARYAADACLQIESGDVFVEDSALGGRLYGVTMSGGNLKAHRVHVVGASAAGIAAGSGSVDLVAAKIDANEVGLALGGRAHATLSRSVLRRSRNVGVYIDGHARFEASSSMFGGKNDGSGNNEYNAGILAREQADTVLTNAWFVDAQKPDGVLIFSEGTKSRLKDIALIGCPSSDVDGVGIDIRGTFTAERLHIADCPVSLLVKATATASIADAYLSANDRGLETEGYVHGERWKLEGGAINGTGGELDVSDLSISGVITIGSAACVSTDGDISFSAHRVRLDLNGRDGVNARARSSVILKNAFVVGSATAIRASDDARVEIERFDVRASLAGLHVARQFSFITETWGTSRILARQGVVHDAHIGALLFDRTLLIDVFNQVRYVSNDQNFVFVDEESSD